jgi:hypothetical protein
MSASVAISIVEQVSYLGRVQHFDDSGVPQRS